MKNVGSTAPKLNIKLCGDSFRDIQYNLSYATVQIKITGAFEFDGRWRRSCADTSFSKNEWEQLLPMRVEEVDSLSELSPILQAH